MTKLTRVSAGFAWAILAWTGMASADDPTARERAVAIDMVAIGASESADVERLARQLRRPWCVAFVPGGDLLITEKYFGVRLLRSGVLQPDVLPGGPPNVFAREDSGVLDIALDPDFPTNRHVYISFAEGNEKVNRTAVWKARYDGSRLTDGRVIFRATPDKADPSHPGGRILFLPDKTFLLTVGDGYTYKSAAQDLGSHLGKILRLTQEGTAAADNPFVGRARVLPEIWT